MSRSLRPTSVQRKSNVVKTQLAPVNHSLPRHLRTHQFRSTPWMFLTMAMKGRCKWTTRLFNLPSQTNRTIRTTTTPLFSFLTALLRRQAWNLVRLCWQWTTSGERYFIWPAPALRYPSGNFAGKLATLGHVLVWYSWLGMLLQRQVWDPFYLLCHPNPHFFP